MKMKWVLIILVIIIVIVVVCAVNQLSKKKEIHTMKEFYYSSSGGMAYNGNTYYKIKCKEKCILDVKLPYKIEKRNIVISDDIVNQIIDVLNQYQVSTWDGFDKNDKNIMDGDSFTLKVSFDDKYSISAHGYMKVPKNYRDVISHISSILDPIYENTKSNSLFELEMYDQFQIDDVDTLIIERRTEAGIEKEEITQIKEAHAKKQAGK